MPVRLSLSDDEIDVYSLLVLGKAQAEVSRSLDMKPYKVCRITKKLVAEKYLVEELRSSIIVYGKGPKGPMLDGVKTANSCNINARGVIKVAKKKYQSKTVNVHHLLYRCRVEQPGLIEKIPDEVKGKPVSRPFLTERKGPYRGNLYRTYGQVPYEEQFLTVFYEENPKGISYLYIYAPEMEISPEEWTQRKWRDYATRAVREIVAVVRSRGGWLLGEPEPTQWIPHFAINDPAQMKGFAENMFMKSRDGKAWLSDSDGKHEFETSAEEYIDVQLNMPGEIVKLKGTVAEMADGFRQLADALYAILEVERLATEIQAHETKRKAEDTIEGARKPESPHDPATAAIVETPYIR